MSRIMPMGKQGIGVWQNVRPVSGTHLDLSKSTQTSNPP